MARCFSGQALRDARIAAHLRPEALAVRIDRSVWSIHSYELGRMAPSLLTLDKIATVLDRRIDDFLTEEEVVGSVA